MNIKCKIRAINKFEFNDKKINLDKKKKEKTIILNCWILLDIN